MKEFFDYQKIVGEKRALERNLKNSENKIAMDKAKSDFNNIYQETKNLNTTAEKLIESLDKYKQVAEKGFSLSEKIIAESKVEEMEYQDLRELDKKVLNTLLSLKTLEQRVTNCGHKMNGVESKYNDAKKQAKESKAEFINSKENYTKSEDKVLVEIEELKKAIAAKEKTLDAATLKTFKEKVERGIFPVLVSLGSNNECKGCGVFPPSGTIEKLNAEGKIICEQCSRIIVKK